MQAAISTRQKAAPTTQVVNLSQLTPAEDKVIVIVDGHHAKLTIWKHHLKQHCGAGTPTPLSTDVRELPLLSDEKKVIGSLRSCDGDRIELWILNRMLRRAGIDPKYIWVEVIG